MTEYTLPFVMQLNAGKGPATRTRKKETAKRPSLDFRIYGVSDSDAALDFAGTEATGTNVHLLLFPVDHNMYRLDIRCPAAFGLAVGMADQITGHDALIADFAVLTHESPPPSKTQTR